jgi:hypothetical protein
MEEMCYEYRSLVEKPDGKRQLESHSSRWEDNIKMDLKGMRYESVNGIGSNGRNM